jgi:hypothetical protein
MGGPRCIAISGPTKAVTARAVGFRLRKETKMWLLLIFALASPGAPGGGVHSSVATLQFQTQAGCENAAKTVNEMTIHSAASSLAVTSSCIQQK